MANDRRKIDWSSWISTACVVCVATVAVGGYLINARLVPKELENKSRFEAIETRLNIAEKAIKINEKDIDRDHDELILALNELSKIILVFKTDLKYMKEGISDIKQKVNK
tara:strand:+ start:1856 stop:2185 length:330 start_codon:yes stop_codon:yes gene_type:complete